MRRYPAVVRRDFDEEDMGQMRILPERGRNVIKPYPRRMPRFEKGSQEAKDYIASIRNNKQGSGFFSKLGKEIKKVAKETENDFKKGANKGKTALFGKRIGDEANVVTVQLCYIYKENSLSSYPEHN